MNQGKAYILAVDDDLDISKILKEVLEFHAYEVGVARDGWEGLKSIHARAPDLIILDIEMPHLNGPDMVYKMLIHDAGMEYIPVLLVSGVTDLQQIALRVGTPYFLGKPFELSSLLSLIKQALLEKRPPNPL